MSYLDYFAGTDDPGSFNNSVNDQQVCNEFLLIIYLVAS